MSLQQNELRIGNYITDVWAAPGAAFKVKFIQRSYTYGSDFKSGYENLLPIPLTPDILLKCGAKEYGGKWEYGISIGAIKLLFRQNSGIWYSELGGIYMGDRFQCVHPVQNIVNALTGQELIFNQQ